MAAACACASCVARRVAVDFARCGCRKVCNYEEKGVEGETKRKRVHRRRRKLKDDAPELDGHNIRTSVLIVTPSCHGTQSSTSH